MNIPCQYWRSLGQVLDAPLQGLPWAASHASYPTPLPLGEETVRVFFSPRDAQGRSSLASVDLALDGDRWELASCIHGPLLTAGPRGAFDADGVTVSCVVPHGGKLLAYYLGWTLGARIPFTNFIGLAVSRDQGRTFVRHSAAPIIGRSDINPYTLGYPWVMRDGETWRMWFGSHLEWGNEGLEMKHVIRAAASDDGFSWKEDAEVVLGLAGEADPQEFALSRPSLLRHRQREYMWYAKRNPGYALGFAMSRGNGAWRRLDHLVRFASPAAAWEARERTYPAVFRLSGHVYMLYNGNGYGRTGFGLARLENPEILDQIDDPA